MKRLFLAVSQIESIVKASMLDLKNSFSDHKVLLFSRQIGVCLPFENGSAIEKWIGVRYSKRELFGLSVDSTLYLGHRFGLFIFKFSSDLPKTWKVSTLIRKRLVVRQVPVKDVHLIHLHQVEVCYQDLLWEEMSGRIQHDTTVTESRKIHYLSRINDILRANSIYYFPHCLKITKNSHLHFQRMILAQKFK